MAAAVSEARLNLAWWPGPLWCGAPENKGWDERLFFWMKQAILQPKCHFHTLFSDLAHQNIRFKSVSRWANLLVILLLVGKYSLDVPRFPVVKLLRPDLETSWRCWLGALPTIPSVLIHNSLSLLHWLHLHPGHWLVHLRIGSAAASHGEACLMAHEFEPLKWAMARQWLFQEMLNNCFWSQLF